MVQSLRSLRAAIISALLLLLCQGLVAGRPQPQTGGPPGGLPAWKKVCNYGVVGTQGCSVKLEMKLSGDICPSGGSKEYCVKIKVTCPDDIPAGDPGEECEFEDCEICPPYLTPVSVMCDGQTFTAAPNQGEDWSAVANDCGNGHITTPQ